MVKSNFKPGTIEVIVGGMYSGKSAELLNIGINMESYGNKDVFYFKPGEDTRDRQVKSRNGNSRECTPFKHPSDIMKGITVEPSMILIDEAQFASYDLVYMAHRLKKMGNHVVISGLPIDYRGMPFGPMPAIMAIADNIIKVEQGTSYCQFNPCNYVGTLPQRLRNEIPSSAMEDTILIEGNDEGVTYEPRCEIHHEVPDLDYWQAEKMVVK